MQYRKALASLSALVLVASAFGACSGQHLKDPDGDGDRASARPFLKGGPTEDRLNTRIGDREDWRFLQPSRKGTMEMRISVGKWKESTVKGHVTIYTEVGDRIAEKPMPEGSGTLRFKFDVENDMRYLVRFRANVGLGEYAVEVDFAGSACDSCSDNQDCVNDQCVARKVTKRPKTKRPRTHRPRPKKPAKAQGIHCKVIDARVKGTGSLLTLTAGDNKGVKRGMKGTIKGLRGGRFTVIAVYPTRSKAACKLPPTKIYGHTTATIR
ncbi:MAG: hypothetical protein KC502_11895 [Myxococcales bacterium]|nr:hypothetical protein [Myxococcales bacterium]